MHWTDRLHRQLIAISDLVNRFDVDARLMAESGIKLDRALYPLLSRIDLNPDIILIDLANLVGRDHSTVSRQVAKLESQGLVIRTPNAKDRRVQHLTSSQTGQALIARIRAVRQAWMEEHFRDWNDKDRTKLISLMGRMLDSEDK